MMEAFAERGPSTVVLPSGFDETASLFQQQLAAKSSHKPSGEAE